ncbi:MULTISPECIES: DNA-directed RNA polymerase subunit beta [unclassified Streptococcus]|uniref:DNA-directed RNA polymerase subunit beta n=1 Tax=unclassified Streptococcus TaxID=2608887 RepID=UPI0018A91460|nr:MULTISPECIES: DNA-directed RNA polymerase subunit beta [unclassified Streptococcus]MBF8969397.1 DNA-directed RNA polymerase subunit beta [Streptococcus sp. NLN76]MBG9366762.1 DNA-directed RNA polymerase subunit beta [Streptococcus sp. NLN64]
MESNWSRFRKQWLMILGFLLLTLLVFAVGLVFGYSVLGEGKNPLEILYPATWSELLEKFK